MPNSAPIINQVRKTENITEGEKIMTMNEIDEDKEKESQKERGTLVTIKITRDFYQYWYYYKESEQ